MPRWRTLHCLLVVLLGLGSLGASCGETAIKIMPGLVNDPSNRSLRRAIFAFAQGELCKEMRARSIPLKMRDADPATGRFFPTGCVVKELDNGNLFVQFTGHGYAWTNTTRRMGFEAAASVEYAHDFIVEGSAMQVYFRERGTQATQLTPLVVELGRSQAATGLAGLFGTSVEAVATQIGGRVLKHQLARGFTVVRESDGAASFGLGVLERGERPLVPFDKGESDWKVLANDRVEVHAGQRDFAGPFVVERAGQALHLTLFVEGAPSVDLLVMAKATADPWLSDYVRQVEAGPPPGTPLLEEAVPAAVAVPGQSPVLFKRMVRVPPGAYYVIFDQTASAGPTAPPGPAGDDRAPHVSYAVQLGDAP